MIHFVIVAIHAITRRRVAKFKTNNGGGLYFSVRLKTTLTAIVATFVACFIESYVLGMLLGIVMMILAFSSSGGMDPEWMFVYQIVGGVVSGVVRIVLGVWFLTRAKANLRRYALTI